MGEHLRRVSHGHYYAKAQNLSRKLRAAFDAALESVDLLLMPTSPITAPPLPPRVPSRSEMMSPGFTPILNTAAFDCTGHPAMSVSLRGCSTGCRLVQCWSDATSMRRPFTASRGP